MKTEKQKMLTGELYDASDPTLFAERKSARRFLHRLNVTEYGDEESYKAILERLLPNCSPDIWIEPPFYCDYGYNIFAGRNVYLNFNCVLLDVMPIRIGSNVLFGPSVQVYTATHPTDYRERRKGPESAASITMGDDCWIGGYTVICPGVTVGKRCIIGAGSVVTKDLPDDAVAFGNPAKPQHG